MKITMIRIFVVLLFVAMHLTSNAASKSRAEIEAKIAAEVAARGGVVTIAPTGNVVRIVNAQRSVPVEFFEPLINDVKKIGISVPIEVNDATKLNEMNPMTIASTSRSFPKTGAVIVFVESKNLPTLLVAPENAWSIINVRNLKVDNPPKKLLEERITKEFWRILAGTLGAMNTLIGNCVMKPVAGLTQLDAISANRLGAESVMKVICSLPAYGIQRYERMPYDEACELGVAPMPTNDIQRAIWAKTHDKKADASDPTNRWKRDFEKK